MSGFQVEGGAPANESGTEQQVTTPQQTEAPKLVSQADIAKLDKNSEDYRNALLNNAAVRRAQKGEAQPANEGETASEEVAEPPKLLLGKFKSVEELEKAYKESQAELTRTKQGAKKETPPKDNKGEQTEGDQDATEADTVDFEALGQEFTANNLDLTEDSKAKLYKKFGQQVVDAHISGLKAQVELNQYKLLEAAGATKTDVTTWLTWAASNLSAGDKAVFNASQQGGQEAAVAGMKMLRSQYESANGKAATRTFESGSSGSSSPMAFKSKGEMTKAIQDPRYKTDRAYQAEVAARVRATRGGVGALR